MEKLAIAALFTEGIKRDVLDVSDVVKAFFETLADTTERSDSPSREELAATTLFTESIKGDLLDVVK